jgi:hypothetical protein
MAKSHRGFARMNADQEDCQKSRKLPKIAKNEYEEENNCAVSYGLPVGHGCR